MDSEVEKTQMSSSYMYWLYMYTVRSAQVQGNIGIKSSGVTETNITL